MPLHKSRSKNKKKNKYTLGGTLPTTVLQDEPKYLSNENRDEFRDQQLFIIKVNDTVSFHYAPLQGVGIGGILASVNINHLLMLVKNENGKTMSIGFYPDGGNILGALYTTKPGYLWTPDPHFIPGQHKSGPSLYYGTEDKIEYKLNQKQANYINNIIFGNDCKLKNGKTSSGLVKRNRLECPIPRLKYSVLLPGDNIYNCHTWLYSIFPELVVDIGGTFGQNLDDLHV